MSQKVLDLEGLKYYNNLSNNKINDALEESKNYTDTEIANLVGTAPETLNTLEEVAKAIEEHQDVTDALNAAIGNKVNKEEGKGLSTNDYTTEEKEKLAGIEEGANNYTLPTATDSVLGGVKIGNNITNIEGIISINEENISDALGFTPIADMEVATGTEIVATDSSSGYATDFSCDGKVEQNGTPTPSTPIAIMNSGDCVEMRQGYYQHTTGIYYTDARFICNVTSIACKSGDVIKLHCNKASTMSVIYYADNGYLNYEEISGVENSYTVPNGATKFNFHICSSNGITPDTAGKLQLTINDKYVLQIKSVGTDKESTSTILLDEPLRVNDKIICINGVYGVQRAMKSKKGSATWKLRGTNASGSTVYSSDDYVKNYARSNAMAMCSKLEYQGMAQGIQSVLNSNITNGIYLWQTDGTAWNTYIVTDACTSVAELNVLLEDAEFIYEMEEPVFEPFSDQTPFYQIPTYEGGTTISTTDRLQPQIEVEYPTNRVSGVASVALSDANTIATNINASLENKVNKTDVIPVAQGGTGTTTLTSGQALIGNGTDAVTTRAINTLNTQNHLDYLASKANNLVSLSALAYWNGRCTSTASNLAYCSKGAFGDAAVKGVDSTPTSASTNLITSDGAYTALDKKANKSFVTATTETGAGWYRIASTGKNINVNTGIFKVVASVAGVHSSFIFTASTCYGVTYNTNVQVLQCSQFTETAPAFSQIRIVYHQTYTSNYAYIEIYKPNNTTAINYNVTMIEGTGWSLITPVAGSIPSGYSNKVTELKSNSIIAEKFVGSLEGSATKLSNTTAIGSATQPVYFNTSGVPVACTNPLNTGTYSANLTSGFADAYRTQVKGSSGQGSFVSVFRPSASIATYAPAYSSAIGWGHGDTHGYLMTQYGAAHAWIGGGNADKLSWVKEIAFTDHTHNYLPLSGGTMTGDITYEDIENERNWNINVNGITGDGNQVLDGFESVNASSVSGEFYGTLYGDVEGNASTANTINNTLPVSKGGTGVTFLTHGQALIGGGSGSVTTRNIDDSPTSSSNSLITSGGVYNALSDFGNWYQFLAKRILVNAVQMDIIVLLNGRLRLCYIGINVVNAYADGSGGRASEADGDTILTGIPDCVEITDGIGQNVSLIPTYAALTSVYGVDDNNTLNILYHYPTKKITFSGKVKENYYGYLIYPY